MPVARPPRSLDLNPLDFFVEEYSKNKVYRTGVLNLEDLREQITTAANNLRLLEYQEGRTFELVPRNWIRETKACVEVDRKKCTVCYKFYYFLSRFQLNFYYIFFWQIDLFCSTVYVVEIFRLVVKTLHITFSFNNHF